MHGVTPVGTVDAGVQGIVGVFRIPAPEEKGWMVCRVVVARAEEGRGDAVTTAATGALA